MQTNTVREVNIYLSHLIRIRFRLADPPDYKKISVDYFLDYFLIQVNLFLCTKRLQETFSPYVVKSKGNAIVQKQNLKPGAFETNISAVFHASIIFLSDFHRSWRLAYQVRQY